MTDRRCTWKEADLRRAIKVATDAGLTITGTRITRDSVELLHSDPRRVDDPDPVREGPQPLDWPDD